MRVIAGTARSLQLKAPEGMDTRPTTDRIKETLFNILNPYLQGAIFIDCFAGSGGIGIEALSRGAKKAYFLEKDKKALDCINKNLQFTRLDKQGFVIGQDIMAGLWQVSDVADIIFMDPPYESGLEKKVLELLSDKEFKQIIDEDTLIIIEAKLDNHFEYVESLGYEVTREKIYKTNKHVFLRRFT